MAYDIHDRANIYIRPRQVLRRQRSLPFTALNYLQGLKIGDGNAITRTTAGKP